MDSTLSALVQRINFFYQGIPEYSYLDTTMIRELRLFIKQFNDKAQSKGSNKLGPYNLSIQYPAYWLPYILASAPYLYKRRNNNFYHRKGEPS